MVITFTQKRKTQKYLVIIFAALILIIAFVFLSDSFKKEETSVVEEPVSENIPTIEIDFQALENPIFKKLSEPFPDLPSAISIEKVGREDPFSPYEENLEEENLEE